MGTQPDQEHQRFLSGVRKALCIEGKLEANLNSEKSGTQVYFEAEGESYRKVLN